MNFVLSCSVEHNQHTQSCEFRSTWKDVQPACAYWSCRFEEEMWPAACRLFQIGVLHRLRNGVARFLAQISHCPPGHSCNPQHT